MCCFAFLITHVWFAAILLCGRKRGGQTTSSFFYVPKRKGGFGGSPNDASSSSLLTFTKPSATPSPHHPHQTVGNSMLCCGEKWGRVYAAWPLPSKNTHAFPTSKNTHAFPTSVSLPCYTLTRSFLPPHMHSKQDVLRHYDMQPHVPLLHCRCHSLRRHRDPCIHLQDARTRPRGYREQQGQQGGGEEKKKEDGDGNHGSQHWGLHKCIEGD